MTLFDQDKLDSKLSPAAYRALVEFIQQLIDYDESTDLVNLLITTLQVNGSSIATSPFIGSDSGDGTGALTVSVTPSSTTAAYIVRLRCLRPVTNDDDLYIRISGGSGASDYRWTFWVDPDGAAAGEASDTADSEIQANSVAATYGVGDAAGEGLSGTITVYPTDGTCETLVKTDLIYQADNGQSVTITGGGIYQSTTAITSIDVGFLGSNVETGLMAVFEDVAA